MDEGTQLRKNKEEYAIFNKTTFENSRAGGIGVLEIVDEKKAKNNEFIFAALKKTELTGDIAGPMASLCLAQTYRFAKEQCDKVLEARYRFPLPGDAAVTGVKVTFGDVEILTELKDRQAAKEEYKEAKARGEKAVMVTRESPDVFTICIAGLEPDTDIKVETRYVQLAQADGIGWSVRIPLTTAPRYVRKDEFSSRHAHGQPLAVLRDPGHRFAMDVKIRGAASVESPTHRLTVAPGENGVRVTLQQGEVVPDRDCILVWKPNQEGNRPLFQVMAQEDGDNTYFLAWLAPPASGDVKKVPGEYILLVDHSGSMHGPKWEAADWAVEKFLLGLGEGDHFTLGLFDDATKWYSRKMVPATQDSVTKAVEFLKANEDGGGTELGVALEQALNVKKLKGDLSRHVLIITDAEVSDGGRILRLVDDEYQGEDRRRISILCIDAAPNSLLANQIAERGGGIAKFLTSDPEEGDISTALDLILEDWASPIMPGIRLSVDRPGLGSANKNVIRGLGTEYIDIGDLTTGRTIWVSGKVKGGIDAGLAFELSGGSGEKLASIVLSAGGGMASLKQIYGARKLLELENLIHSRHSGKDLAGRLLRLGYDPSDVLQKKSSLYPENSEVKEMEALRGFIVKESLGYGLPSSETALIAVYHKAGKKVEATALVPNALPDGWSDDFASAEQCCSPAPGGVFAASPALASVRSAPKKLSKSMRPGKVANNASILVPEPQIKREEDFKAYVSGDIVVFSGMAASVNGEVVLYEASAGGTLSSIMVEFPGGLPASIDRDLVLLVFADDMAVPRAKVRLADLVRQNGFRPLNIAVSGALKLVLADPAGAWAKAAPLMEIKLSVQ